MRGRGGLVHLYCNRCICGREEEIHGHVRCVCVLVCGWRGRGTVEIGYLWGVWKCVYVKVRKRRMWRFKECCKAYKNRFFCQGQRKDVVGPINCWFFFIYGKRLLEMKNRAPCKTCNRDAIPPSTTKKGFKVLQYYM